MNYYHNFNTNHFKKCIQLYNSNTDISSNKILNNDILVHTLKHYENNDLYNKYINELSDILQHTQKKQFIPNVSEIYILSNNITILLSKLNKLIIPYFEQNIYKCYLQVIDTKILNHYKNNSRQQGAFNWHYDNHPQDITNIIIYLNDVDINSGPFQYITINNNIIKKNFTTPAGNKNMNGFVQSNNTTIHSIIGKKGHIFYFDNNIIHRASRVLHKKRLALLIQVKPSLRKLY